MYPTNGDMRATAGCGFWTPARACITWYQVLDSDAPKRVG